MARIELPNRRKREKFFLALNDRLSLLRRVSFRSAVKRLLARIRTIELPHRRKREKFFLALNDRLSLGAVKRLLARIELPNRRKREKFFWALNDRLSSKLAWKENFFFLEVFFALNERLSFFFNFWAYLKTV